MPVVLCSMCKKRVGSKGAAPLVTSALHTCTTCKQVVCSACFGREEVHSTCLRARANEHKDALTRANPVVLTSKVQLL